MLRAEAAEAGLEWIFVSYGTELELLKSAAADGFDYDLIVLVGKPALLTAVETVQRLRRLPNATDIPLVVVDPFSADVAVLKVAGADCWLNDGVGSDTLSVFKDLLARKKWKRSAASRNAGYINIAALLPERYRTAFR